MVAEGRGGAAGALAFDDLVEAAGSRGRSSSHRRARRGWHATAGAASARAATRPRLNLGDCFAYALARSRGEPLLFKGDDFSKTDVKAAL